eukprot:scaffold4611_cov253-Pinguiococcus_pyrenoidosus.AAC.3
MARQAVLRQRVPCAGDRWKQHLDVASASQGAAGVQREDEELDAMRDAHEGVVLGNHLHAQGVHVVRRADGAIDYRLQGRRLAADAPARWGGWCKIKRGASGSSAAQISSGTTKYTAPARILRHGDAGPDRCGREPCEGTALPAGLVLSCTGVLGLVGRSV